MQFTGGMAYSTGLEQSQPLLGFIANHRLLRKSIGLGLIVQNYLIRLLALKVSVYYIVFLGINRLFSQYRI